MSRANATRTVRSDASVVVGARDRVGGGGPTCRARAPRQPVKSRMRSRFGPHYGFRFFHDWFVIMVFTTPPNALTECPYDPRTLFVKPTRGASAAKTTPFTNRLRWRTDIVPRAVVPLSLARDIRCLPPAPFSRPRRSRRRVSRRGDRARDPRVARPPPRRARVRGRWTMRFAAARPPRRAPRPSARCSRTRRTA